MPGSTGTSSRIFGIRSTASGAGAGSRQRLAPGADAVLATRATGPACVGFRAKSWSCVEALQIVPRRRGDSDLERAPPHHADKAEAPAGELSKQQKPVTTGERHKTSDHRQGQASYRGRTA